MNSHAFAPTRAQELLAHSSTDLAAIADFPAATIRRGIEQILARYGLAALRPTMVHELAEQLEADYQFAARLAGNR